jgi:hypothetical protein
MIFLTLRSIKKWGKERRVSHMRTRHSNRFKSSKPSLPWLTRKLSISSASPAARRNRGALRCAALTLSAKASTIALQKDGPF